LARSSSGKAATASATRKKTAAKTARKKTPSRKTAAANVDSPRETEAVEAAVSSLQGLAARLERSLEEVPTPADFEPLAENLYELARYAPRLLEALEALPRVEGSARALQETAETLQYVQSSFDESLLRLPRAEDYEPLAQPLREFARVSPALAESLASVLRTTTPLSEAVQSLRQLARELRPAAPVSDREPARSAVDPDVVEDLRASISEVMEARAALNAALASLPDDPEYKRVAEQLREIASVSPSLLDWLSQVDPISRPLGDSVSSLRMAADRLEKTGQRLSRVVERLRQATG
jgi:hypothetical protein